MAEVVVVHQLVAFQAFEPLSDEERHFGVETLFEGGLDAVGEKKEKGRKGMKK